MSQTRTSRTLGVLKLNSSGRIDGSATRALTADVVGALAARYGDVEIVERDLAAGGIPFVDEAWIAANFTPAEERTEEQRRTLALSDRLVEELRRADVLVMGVPMYNFGVPAVLKAWVDMIARARLTFRYTDSGPEGLLTGKKAYVVVASGGVAVGSETDFATPYIKQALAFVGITDVELISAERINQHGDEALDAARLQIAERVHTKAPLATRAA